MPTERSSPRAPDPVAVFAPNPLLGILIEARGSAGDDIHLHPSGHGCG